MIDDKNKIIEEIFRFYTKLYKSDRSMEDKHEERQKSLNLIQNKITVEENEQMLKEPEDDEIERLVMALPKEKLFGLDGMIAKILQKFWPTIRPTYVALVKAY